MSIVGGAPAMLDSSARSRVTVNDTLRRVLGEIEKPDGRSTLVDYSDLGAKHRAEARAIMEAAPLKIMIRRTPATGTAAPMAEVPRLALAEEAVPERAAAGAGGGSVAPQMPKMPAKQPVDDDRFTYKDAFLEDSLMYGLRHQSDYDDAGTLKDVKLVKKAIQNFRDNRDKYITNERARRIVSKIDAVLNALMKEYGRKRTIPRSVLEERLSRFSIGLLGL